MQDHPLHILKWYAANGVDLAVGDLPINRFDLPASATATLPVTKSVSNSGKAENGLAAPAQLPQMSSQNGSELAAEANDLAALRTVYSGFDGCALKLRASNFVFESGTPQSQVMIVGGAPSSDDENQGEAFSGRVGQLLDKMLGSIGLDRSQVYMANVVPWRPPGNRNPSPHEISPCLPFLIRQIELAKPKIILAFGEVSARTILTDPKISINRVRGQWYQTEHGAWSGDVISSLHPSFLLRQPAQKREAWQDLLALQARLESI